MKTSYPKEFCVIGAGLVGAIQALLLARAGNRVTLVERRVLGCHNSASDPLSSRTVALSHRTWQLLSEAELWPAIDYCPIQAIHVTEQGKFGSVKMHAQEIDVEALGFVLSNSEFESYLHKLVTAETNIKLVEDAQLVSIDHTSNGVEVTLTVQEHVQVVSANVLIAADGTSSLARSMIGVEVEQYDYQQCAVIANVATAKPHESTAYERFTPSGPLALLPLSSGAVNKGNNYYSMIYTALDNELEKLKGLSDQQFLVRLQEKFGGKLGRFNAIGPRYVMPLMQTVSAKQVEKNCVLIGNAARTLHPVAGQGLNLAMRDVFELCAVLSANENTNAALQTFTDNRHRDQSLITRQTNLLARAFTHKPWPLRVPISMASSSSFFLLDFIDPLRKKFAQVSMGHHVALPR